MDKSYREPLPLGWLAPNFSLPDANDKECDLSNFAQLPSLMVVFTSHLCPAAQFAWPLLVDSQLLFRRQLAVVAINTDASIAISERKLGMQQAIVQYNLNFPYLVDTELVVANQYRVVNVPDVFIFKNFGGGEWRLFYRGAINDNLTHPVLVSSQYAVEAVKKLLAGGDPPAMQPAAVGCAISAEPAARHAF